MVLASVGRYKSQKGAPSAEDDGPPSTSCGLAHSRGSHADLSSALQRLEGRPYPAYHDMEGAWSFPGFTFILDRAQSDPFAQPSRCRILVRSELNRCLRLVAPLGYLPGHDLPIFGHALFDFS